MQIELTYDELQYLNFVIGIACGTFLNTKDKKLFHATLRLANAVNRNNPNFDPYAVPDEGPAETPAP